MMKLFKENAAKITNENKVKIKNSPESLTQPINGRKLQVMYLKIPPKDKMRKNNPVYKKNFW